MTFPLFPLLPGMGAEVVYADPPWKFSAGTKGRPQHYRRMTLAEIEALPVREIVAPNAVLFMWITGPLLVLGAHLPIFKAWGFKPAASGFVWVKLDASRDPLFFMRQDLFKGPGFTTRKNAEFCLIGKRGRSLRVHKSIDEIVIAPRREHSRKPDEVLRSIERYVGPGRTMVELFSRSGAAGWHTFGDEVGKFGGAAA